MDDQSALEKLLDAQHPCLFIPTYEEEYVANLIGAAALSRPNRRIMSWSAVNGLRDGLLEDPQTVVRDTMHPAAAMVYLAAYEGWSVAVLWDAVGHLQDERTLRALRELLVRARVRGRTVILIDHNDEPPSVIGAYAHRLELSLPDEAELESLVVQTLRQMNQQRKIDIRLTRQDFDVIIKNLRGLSRRQAQRIIIDIVSEDRKLDARDVNRLLAQKRQALQIAGVLEYVQTPVDLTEIGGLARLKRWLEIRRLALMSKDPYLPAPRGVLLLGVQGAGKSLCAKAIATAWQRPLLRMDPSALYDHYIGESEKHLRQALHQADAMAPVVLWIDEIEKGFASAASRSVDGGLSARMFGTLLTWMQERQSAVFMVATANDIEALPPELLRKGRFDEIFFVDLPVPATREMIFRIHLSKRGQDPAKFDLAALSTASDGYSGAEIEQAIIAGLFTAAEEKATLTTAHVQAALAGSPPLSVTLGEKVQALRDWASGRCVPAD